MMKKDKMKQITKEPGVTLVELVIAMAVFGIMTVVAVPSFTELTERTRIKGAAEAVYVDLQFARSEAIKTNQAVSLAFAADNTTSWTSTMTMGGNTIKHMSNNIDGPYIGIKMKGLVGNTPAFGGGSIAQFEPTRGRAITGTVVLLSDNYELRVIVSLMGRIRICSPAGSTSVAGYPSC